RADIRSARSAKSQRPIRSTMMPAMPITQLPAQPPSRTTSKAPGAHAMPAIRRRMTRGSESASSPSPLRATARSFARSNSGNDTTTLQLEFRAPAAALIPNSSLAGRNTATPLLGLAAGLGSARHVESRHHALEQVVWLRAHNQVAVGDHMRRNAVDHQFLSLGALGVEIISEPVRGHGRLHRGGIDPRPQDRKSVV